MRVKQSGVIPDLDWITWLNRNVIIAYDADLISKIEVRQARHHLSIGLRQRGANVGYLEWNPKDGMARSPLSSPAASTRCRAALKVDQVGNGGLLRIGSIAVLQQIIREPTYTRFIALDHLGNLLLRPAGQPEVEDFLVPRFQTL